MLAGYELKLLVLCRNKIKIRLRMG